MKISDLKFILLYLYTSLPKFDCAEILNSSEIFSSSVLLISMNSALILSKNIDENVFYQMNRTLHSYLLSALFKIYLRCAPISQEQSANYMN